MQLLGDERGVSTQVGAILIFATLVIFLGVYQSQVVPAENRQAEFRHGQEIEQDMQRLYGTLFDIGASGGTRPVTLQVGFRYPFRLLAVNPPPVSGTLRANTTGAVTLGTPDDPDAKQNKLRTACGYGTGDGTIRTSTLEYEPDYNLYRNAPSTVYDNTALYQRVEGGDVLRIAGQSLVEGQDITVILLPNGDYRVSRPGAVTVDLKAGPTGTTTINPGGDRLNLTFPSQLDATGGDGTWNSLLADERQNGYVESVSQATPDRVSVALASNTKYTVTCYAVGLDETPPSGYRPLEV